MSEKTARNAEICREVLAGASYRAIAEKHGITPARVSQIFHKSPEGELHTFAMLHVRIALLEDCCANPEGRQGGPACLPRWREDLEDARDRLAWFEAKVAARRARIEALARAYDEKKRFWENCLRNAP